MRLRSNWFMNGVKSGAPNMGKEIADIETFCVKSVSNARIPTETDIQIITVSRLRL